MNGLLNFLAALVIVGVLLGVGVTKGCEYLNAHYSIKVERK